MSGPRSLPSPADAGSRLVDRLVAGVVVGAITVAITATTSVPPDDDVVIPDPVTEARAPAPVPAMSADPVPTELVVATAPPPASRSTSEGAETTSGAGDSASEDRTMSGTVAAGADDDPSSTDAVGSDVPDIASVEDARADVLDDDVHAASTARDGEQLARLDLDLDLGAVRWLLETGRAHLIAHASLPAGELILAVESLGATALGGRYSISASVPDVVARARRLPLPDTVLSRHHGESVRAEVGRRLVSTDGLTLALYLHLDPGYDLEVASLTRRESERRHADDSRSGDAGPLRAVIEPVAGQSLRFL